MGIRKSWFSPYRPVGHLTKKTAVVDRTTSEILPPYDPNLAIPSKQVLNYWRPVHGIQSILSIPTRLESTLILFAYGHDVYITRVMPSDTFDRLKDSFSKSFLLITLLGLMSAIFITSKLARRKRFYAYW